jgi:cob(I)alamin adenosyltransferase
MSAIADEAELTRDLMEANLTIDEAEAFIANAKADIEMATMARDGAIIRRNLAQLQLDWATEAEHSAE